MAEEVYKSPEVFKKPIKLPKVESSEKGALSTTAPQEDPVYRKKVYNFLKRELSDFKLSEDDFYKKLDTDQAYAPKVYSFLKNNFSDFSKPEQDFLFLMTPSKKKRRNPNNFSISWRKITRRFSDWGRHFPIHISISISINTKK